MSKILSTLAAPQPVTLRDLERIGARVSLESEHLANFATTLRNVVPSLVDTTKGFLTRLIGKESQLATIEKPNDDVLNYTEFRKFLMLMEAQRYMSITNLRWYVPEGFKGHMVPYVETLMQCVKHTNGIVGEVLNPYAQFLSRIVSSKNATMNTTRDLGFLAKRDAEREHYQKEVGQFFSHGSSTAKSSIGECFTRNADWKPFLNGLGDLRRDSEFVKPDVVQQTVKDVMQLLDALKDAVHAGELDNSSAATLKNLSEGTLSAAREVEFYSVTMFRIWTLSNVTETNMKAMPALLKE